MTFHSFIKYWNKLYDYPDDCVYRKTICKGHLNKDDIVNLFEWKNGMRLSGKKMRTVKKINSQLYLVNKLKQNFSLEVYKNDFAYLAAIWKVFLLHIIKPNEFPVFDQHVYRAYYYLKNKEIKQLPTSGSAKERIYFEEYTTWIREMSKSGLSMRDMDRALWKFGKTLKNRKDIPPEI